MSMVPGLARILIGRLATFDHRLFVSLFLLRNQDQRIALVNLSARFDHTMFVEVLERLLVILRREDRHEGVAASVICLLPLVSVLVHVLGGHAFGEALAYDDRILKVHTTPGYVCHTGIHPEGRHTFLVGEVGSGEQLTWLDCVPDLNCWGIVNVCFSVEGEVLVERDFGTFPRRSFHRDMIAVDSNNPATNIRPNCAHRVSIFFLETTPFLTWHT